MIYIPLLDEGIDVWRPTQAESLGSDIYRILGVIPDGEVWAFKPGELVRCRKTRLSGGVHDVAIERVDLEPGSPR